MDEISIEDARPKLGEIIDRARIAGQSTVITRHGKPAAVLVPVDWHRTAVAVGKGVYAFTHDTDGGRLPERSELPVGELMSAIGEAAIEELEKS